MRRCVKSLLVWKQKAREKGSAARTSSAFQWVMISSTLMPAISDGAFTLAGSAAGAGVEVADGVA
jgi:hypothetical protein